MEAKRGLKPPVYVDTDAALSRLIASLRTQPMIAVDTEANPLFAYREKLCLIQVSTRTKDYIVDPLSGIDLSQFVPLFADPNVVKIFHDAEFDILMLKKTLPVEMLGIYDTKVVATSLGLSTVGLAPILKEFFGVTLDKKYQRSDWGRRPLTDGQLDYARYDTHFLIPLMADLREKMSAADEVNQLEVASEFRRVEQLVPDVKPFNPDDFVRIKGWDRLDPVNRRTLRELFVMRHELADEFDRPAFKVLPNDVLLSLARSQPTTLQSLKKSRVMSEKLRDRHGEAVMAAISRGQKLSPLPDDKIHRTKSDQDRLSDEQRDVYEALRNWRKNVAAKRGVDASLVLPRPTMFALSRLRSRPKTLESLLGCGVLEPWRVSHYGEGIVSALAEPVAHRSRHSKSESRSNGMRDRRRNKKRRSGNNRSGDSS
jgi:ribonuclease D